MKRLVVCSDGTWQKFGQEYPTNVAKIAQAILPQDEQGIEQIIFHDDGIGTENGLYKLFGGAFGWGIDQNILEGYRFLSNNYQPGDEIYLFGFSRGAYTVRSLVGLINMSGLGSNLSVEKAQVAYQLYRNKELTVDSPEVVKYRQDNGDRVPIKLLGCWDTVGSLGLPDLFPIVPIDKLLNRKYQFHNTELSDIIENAAHAVAIDETRKSFNYTPMLKSRNKPEQVVNQTWFPGEHGHVGGGSKDDGKNQRPAFFGLSDCALLWMIEIAQNLGLASDPARIEGEVNCNPLIGFQRGATGFFQFMPQIDRAIPVPPDTFHASVYERWQKNFNNYQTTPNLQAHKAILEAGQSV